MRFTKTSLLVMLGGVGLLAGAPATASAADLDCADFSNQAEAQEYLPGGDPHGLDGDNDGVACEALPCPCNYGSPPPPSNDPGTVAPPPPPAKLSKPAARRAAKRKARRFVRSHRNLRRLAFAGCARRNRHKIRCSFVVRGGRTVCRLRIVVRGEGSDARARIARVRCRR